MNPYQFTHDKSKTARGIGLNPDGGTGSALKRPLNLVVLGLGVASTAITLVLMMVVRSESNIDPMLWFVDGIIPFGALVVGCVAGIGYGAGSWLTQSRLSRTALIILATLHTVAWIMLYVLAWWRWQTSDLGYASVGFIDWFDMLTRGLQFTESNGHPTSVLGGFGYMVRLGEVIGFIGGGLILPLILFAKPYCETCKRYFTHRDLFSLPAAAPHIRFAFQKTLDAANAPVQERLLAQMACLSAAITSGSAEQVCAAVHSVAPFTDKNDKIQSWVSVVRHRCPRCGTGLIDFMSITTRQSKRLQRLPITGEVLEAIDEAALRIPQDRLLAKTDADSGTTG